MLSSTLTPSFDSSRKPTLRDIQLLEAEMKQSPLQVEIETVHHFSEGIYAREIFIPAGVRLVGKIHKTAHLNIISRGAITVWTEEGQKYLEAPCTFIAQPNTKRVGQAHTGTVWTTIHANPTNSQNLEQLESELIVPENNLLEDKPCHGLQ